MRNTFTFVGKLMPIKDSENFKGYEENKIISKKNGSTWNKRKMRFNIVCGDNRHLVECDAFIGDEKSTVLKLKQQINEDGKTKYENLDVKFKDRFNEDVLMLVAPFQRFIFDTTTFAERIKVEKLMEKIQSGEVTDSDISNAGFTSVDEVKKANETIKENRKIFISEWDMTEYIHKFINSDKNKDMTFKVIGDIVFEHSNDKNYRKYKVRQILATTEDVTSEGDYCFYYNKDAIDDSDFEETGKIHVNGYLRDYDSQTKSQFGIPMTFTIDKSRYDNEKKALGFKKKFSTFDNDDVEFKEIGLKCTILDGAQKTEIDISSLPESVQEDIEFGLITLEDVKRELGGSVYGDRIQDVIIDSFSRGYVTTGPKDTVYTINDFGNPKSIEVEEDIFDDDEI